MHQPGKDRPYPFRSAKSRTNSRGSETIASPILFARNWLRHRKSQPRASFEQPRAKSGSPDPSLVLEQGRARPTIKELGAQA